jgi:hypothetical protein
MATVCHGELVHPVLCPGVACLRAALREPDAPLDKCDEDMPEAFSLTLLMHLLTKCSYSFLVFFTVGAATDVNEPFSEMATSITLSRYIKALAGHSP